jgi:hypothetical protein
MKNYNDKLEKSLTAFFGALGTIAIIANLFLKGWSIENLLDALKDIAGLIVVIAVFLIANKLFIKDKKFDFNALFERYLKDWIDQNDYLVDDNFDEEGKGKFKKRYCSMIFDHTNMVTQNKIVKTAAPRTEKAAFVYLPYPADEGKHEFEFRFNEKTFTRQDRYKENGEVVLEDILNDFTRAINGKFNYLNIRAKTNPSSKTITVNFDEMERTESNAKKLVDMVEFVKTMVLAIA